MGWVCDMTSGVLEERDDPMIAGGIPPALLIPTAEKRALSALPIKFISCEPRGSVAQTGARYELGNAGRTAESKPQTWVCSAAITRSRRGYVVGYRPRQGRRREAQGRKS